MCSGKIKIEQWLHKFTLLPDPPHYGKWYISKSLGYDENGWEKFVYLWPDGMWHSPAWLSENDHAYYDSREEAIAALERCR